MYYLSKQNFSLLNIYIIQPPQITLYQQLTAPSVALTADLKQLDIL